MKRHLMVLRSIAVVASLGVALGPVSSAWAQSQDVPRSHSSLYYRMGGGSPASRSANPGALSVRLGLGGALKLNYSCGRFDVGLSWSTLMNGFSQLGTQVTNAVRAGIGALPLYILQRAQPGLYELFQTYSKKADVAISAALQSCEQMEAQIKAGNDPYAQWVGLAKGEGWKVQANTPGTDLVSAKTSIETAGGVNGIGWIGGVRAGGALQNAIRPVNDVTVAGYNLALNQPVTGSNTMNYTSTQLPLPKAFPTPQSAADFATTVLGDMTVATCDDVNCPAKGSQAGTGLMPRYEAEIPLAQTQLATALSAPNPNYANLDPLQAPGVAVTTDVIKALRDLPPDVKSIASQRLAKEIALARTIDKALYVRNLLVTGLTIPEVQAADPSRTDVQRRIADLNRYIDDLMFESRVRREIVSTTSALLLQSYQGSKATSTTNGSQAPSDASTLTDGRVQ